MFPLLTTILLWIAIVFIVWYVLTKLVPKKTYTQIGLILVLLVVVLAFFNPNDNFGGQWWSLISLPLQPLGLVIFLLGTALRQGKGKVNGDFVVWAFVLLLAASLPVSAYFLAQQVVVAAPKITSDATPVGAIVLFGRGTTRIATFPRREVQLTETGDRILVTARVYAEQLAARRNSIVIVSAGPRPGIPLEQPNAIESKDLRVLLSQMGVPLAQIVEDDKGLDVRTTAEAVDRILRERNLKNQPIIVVTSGLQMQRVLATFAQLGIIALPRPTDFLSGNLRPVNFNAITLPNLIPNVYALALTTEVIGEYLVRIYYYLRGWQGTPPCCVG